MKRAILAVRKDRFALGLPPAWSWGNRLTITFRHGTLEVETDEQLGHDVQVAVRQNGEMVQVVDASPAGRSVSTRANTTWRQRRYDQFQFDHRAVGEAGRTVKVKVTLKPPPPTVAPFDAAQALSIRRLG